METKMIPYGRQWIDEEDLFQVARALRSDFLTTGPKIKEFEQKFAQYVGAKFAVAVSSGTAGLHLACLAAGLKPEDEVLSSPLTFAASTNCVLYCGAKPVFVDITPQGLIDVEKIEEKITKNSRMIIPVHYSGLSCDLAKIRQLADKYNLIVIEDACHALGAKYKDTRIGDCAYSDLTVFSLHPVKQITSGEGGVVTTNSLELYRRLILLRSHGITKRKEELINPEEGPWHQEMHCLGFNYRITDFQCALASSQLRKLDSFLSKRRLLAQKYDEAFHKLEESNNLEIIPANRDQVHAYHLYVVKVKNKEIRLKLFNYLLEAGIAPQVHYLPIYLHPYYQQLGFSRGLCPAGEAFYGRIISLPLFPALTDKEQEEVIKTITNFFQKNKLKEKSLPGPLLPEDSFVQGEQRKVGIVIQARMGSTRLPGKIMLNLAGKPVLEHVLERCKMMRADQVILATSTNSENDCLEEFCRQNGVPCFRGSEEDVLGRYYLCAQKFKLDVVVRITSDCPLVDPQISDQVISKFKEGNYDYVSNVAEVRTFPRGLDTEVFSFALLKKLNEICFNPRDREHVTRYIIQNLSSFKIFTVINDVDDSSLRWTLDEEADFKLIQEIYSRLYPHNNVFLTTDILELLSREPGLSLLNKHVEQKKS